MELAIPLKDDPKDRTYSDLLRYFIDAAKSQSIFGKDVFNHLVSPLEVALDVPHPVDLGAMLMPRLTLESEIKQKKLDIKKQGNHPRPIQSDDFALALSQLYHENNADNAYNLSGIFLASWFSKASVERLTLGTVFMGQQVWGTQCPIIRAMVELSAEHARYIHVAPVQLTQLPIPSLGHYLAFNSLNQFLHWIAFHFVALVDRYMAVPITVIPERGSIGRIINNPINLPLPSSPAMSKPVTGGAQKLEPTRVPSPQTSSVSAISTREADFAAQSRVSRIKGALAPYGIQEVPDATLQIVLEGKNFTTISPSDMQQLAWSIPTIDLKKYLGCNSWQLKEFFKQHQLIHPNDNYFEAVGLGLTDPITGKVNPDYALEVGDYISPTPAQMVRLIPLFKKLVNVYHGETLHPDWLDILNTRLKCGRWTDEQLLMAAWTLPAEMICRAGYRNFSHVLNHRKIQPVPKKGYWEQVKNGDLPYPNGVPYDPDAKPSPFSEEQQAMLAMIFDQMKEYVDKTPAIAEEILLKEYSLKTIPTKVLQEAVWSLPVVLLEPLLATTRYKLKQRCAQDHIVMPKAGFWMLVAQGRKDYPAGKINPEYDPTIVAKDENFPIDVSGIEQEKLVIMSNIKVKLRRYTQTPPKVLYTALKDDWTIDSITKHRLTQLMWSSPSKLLATILRTTKYALETRAQVLGCSVPETGFWDGVAKGAIPYPATKVNSKFIK